MNKLSARQNGKTINEFYKYIEQIKNWKTDNYVLYVDKNFWNNYKNEFKECLNFTKIIITESLPEGVNAVYMKEEKLEWK